MTWVGSKFNDKCSNERQTEHTSTEEKVTGEQRQQPAKECPEPPKAGEARKGSPLEPSGGA